MTLQTLKNLFNELQRLRKKQAEIYSNNDLSRNQMNAEFQKIAPRMQQIENILGEYSKTFKIEAIVLANELKKLFINKFPKAQVGVVHECIGEHADVEHFYGYHHYFEGTKTMALEIIKNNNSELIVLHKEQTSEDLSKNLDYLLGRYKVNIYELLLNNNLKYTNLIHKACWLAISETVKTKNKEKVKENKNAQTLIQKKIKELQKKSKKLENETISIQDNNETIFSDDEFMHSSLIKDEFKKI